MSGLNHNTVIFLKNLKSNNNREWFEKNKKIYEAAKDDFQVLVTDVIAQLGKMDSGLAGIDPKKSIFRIYRDVRFSADKSPYKPNMGAYFNKGGKQAMTAGYYMHVEPGGNAFGAGGSWQPMPEQLAAIRQEIDYNFKEFKKILNAAGFKKQFSGIEGEKLKTVPKGYDAENPAIEFLKQKSFIVSSKFTDRQLEEKNFSAEIAGVFRQMKPLIEFLNHAMGY